MEYFRKKIISYLKLRKSVFLYIQLIVSGVLLITGVWTFATFLKPLILDYFKIGLYPWAKFFFHPELSKLLNYTFAAIAFSLSYFVFLSDRTLLFLKTKLCNFRINHSVIIVVSILILLIISKFIRIEYRLILFLTFFLVSLLHLFYPSFFYSIINLSVNGIKKSKFLIKYIPYFFLLLISLEALPLVKGPVFLMNEYQNIYSQSRVGDVFVNNKDYLSKLYTSGNIESHFFKSLNTLEYLHQNMTRGQVDHISYILNPLNEYYFGKDKKNIYFQYGWGNTLLFGYTMRLFGGLSVDNYYKCYIFYFIYSILFLLALYYIFKNPVYVAGVFSVYTITFFCMGFNCFILAPGIIPSIHIFDAIVFPFFLAYLIKKRIYLLVVSIVFALLAAFFNLLFGGALLIALFVALSCFANKNEIIAKLKFWLFTFFLIASIFVGFLLISSLRNNFSLLKYYLLGLYSFSPGRGMVIFTFTYFIISYFFLFVFRKNQVPSKYLYIFVFFYTQFLFLYYYWSGITNHLPIVIQFIGLQLFLMLYMLEDRFSNKNGQTLIKICLYLFTIIAVIFASFFVFRFNFDKRESGKITFLNNFKEHRVFNWHFERAKLITTIDPNPIQEAISLIQKYSSTSDSGIYIVSKYDNLIPFLAKRYSLMPHFSMSGYLLNEQIASKTVALINNNKPEYIFVDSDIELISFDPWSPLFNDRWSRGERESRFRRYLGLRKIFDAVKDEYVCFESSKILTVYKRKIK